MEYARSEHQMSLRRACILFALSSSVYYYRTKRKPEDERISGLLGELATTHPRWGFWMMHHHLRLNGYRWNHKRVYRIYTAMKLNLRRKHKRRLPTRIKQPLSQPLAPNLVWSMDFMSDGLLCGAPFRSFNIIDDYNREALHITIDKSINSGRVIRELQTLTDWRGQPERIRVDNGPEFLAYAMQAWCKSRGIELIYIQKGKPSQNGYVERFNRTYREEVLDCYGFENLGQARTLTQAWMWIYNNERPHSSLGYRTPRGFLEWRGGREPVPRLEKDPDLCFKSLITNVAS